MITSGNMKEHSAPLISIVIPAYNEAENIRRLFPDIHLYLEQQPWRYEVIYVNDGSSDGTDVEIRQLAKQYKPVRFIKFSRNFGKEAATTAGIRAAKGDAVVMMDADGQFPYEKISEFVERWQQGAEVVIGIRRSNQREGWVKKYGSKLFYWVLNPLTAGNSTPGETDFRLIDRKVVDKFNEFSERNRITRGLIDWLGFERVLVNFDANARASGQAAYTFQKLVKLALHTFVSQSTKPLLFTGVLGMFVMLASLVTGIFMVTERYILGDPLHLAITGAAVLAVFLSFLVGIVLVCQGLLALYIESIHHETQNRPLYVISEEG